ncbi:MAG: glucuronate isomerase, partial [Pseudomonadota bacterium]
MHSDRFFPADPTVRDIARRFFKEIETLPLICPHGHTEPAWFAENKAFSDPAQLLIVPDHYVVRMLVSQGMTHAELGVPTRDGSHYETDSRAIWRRFAENYTLFRSTPVRHWMDYTLENLFGVTERLSGATADTVFDAISEKLNTEAFRPRALFDQFKIEVLSTTDSCLDSLPHHRSIRG